MPWKESLPLSMAASTGPFEKFYNHCGKQVGHLHDSVQQSFQCTPPMQHSGWLFEVRAAGRVASESIEWILSGDSGRQPAGAAR